MICKTCGYEAKQNFYICPSCGGDDVVSENKKNQEHQQQNNQYQQQGNQYQQQNNQYQQQGNQYQQQGNQYQQQNNQYQQQGNQYQQQGNQYQQQGNQYQQQGNQYQQQNNQYQQQNNQYQQQNNQYQQQGNQYQQQGNQYQQQGNQYQQNQPNNGHSVFRNYKSYGSNMPDYFRDSGCTFEIEQNELRMSRSLNDGDFTLGSKVVGVLSFFVGLFAPILILLLIMMLEHLIFSIGSSLSLNRWLLACYSLLLHFALFLSMLKSLISGCIFGFPFILIISGVVFVVLSNRLTIAKIRVNSTGITIKTVLKEYFLPKEKIDSILHRTVTRRRGSSRGRHTSESFYDIFIVMKDTTFFNKHNLDTGLCYKNKIHADYLMDMFNERLGFL